MVSHSAPNGHRPRARGSPACCGGPARPESPLHPLRRYGTPQDMANLVNWLAGDEARYASGQLWVLDGGLSAQIQQMRV